MKKLIYDGYPSSEAALSSWIHLNTSVVIGTKNYYAINAGTMSQSVREPRVLSENFTITFESRATAASEVMLYIKYSDNAGIDKVNLPISKSADFKRTVVEYTSKFNTPIEYLKMTITGTLDITNIDCLVDVPLVEDYITKVETTVAEIDHLLAGNITADNIQAGSITSDKLVIEDGYIKDAMIDTITASKITSGEINTSKIRIVSDNGGITIADNTQQFRDKDGVVRVQIGQDATGNFSFGIFDETGTGVLIDATGVKDKALADGIIKDRMIGNGEITGSKVDIGSLVEEVNKDGNTSTIKSSKIQIDAAGQTLDIAFKEVKTQTLDNYEAIQANSTSIKAANGKIETLITDTTIEKDGQVVKLKDAYSALEQKVDGFSIKVEETVNKTEEVAEKVELTVKDIDVEYAMNSSAITPPVTGWQSETPTWEDGKFIWSRTVTTYVNNTRVTSEPVCITGATGASGADAILLNITSSNGHTFKNTGIATTLTVTIMYGGACITSSLDMYAYFGRNAKIIWQQKAQDETVFTDISQLDPRLSDNGFILTLTANDVNHKNVFNCLLDY